MPDRSEGSRVRRALRELTKLVLGPYRFNRIYRLASREAAPKAPDGISFGRVDNLLPRAIASPELRDRFCYGGHDAYGYGLFVDGCLAVVCWFWGPQRFEDPLLWHLGKKEAILVDLVTAPNYRGRGLASVLIRHASSEMRRTGWSSLYTWMWHTHHASYHAFERAGWEQVAWVLEIHPFGMRRALRFSWRPVRRRARRNGRDHFAEFR
jgi:GNAT superfamily N-acetyltransferase